MGNNLLFKSGVSKLLNVVTKTGTYTATSADDIVLCNAAAAFTLTLPPAASNAGKVLELKKTDASLANLVTIDGNGSETIDGALTTTLATQYEAIIIVCDGTGWNIVARSYPSGWSSVTVTGNWVSNAAYTAKAKRVGSSAQFIVLVTMSGAPTSATLAVTLPSGYVIDTTQILGTTALNDVIPASSSAVMDVSGSEYHYLGKVGYSSTTVVTPSTILIANTNTHGLQYITQATPMTFATGDKIFLDFTIPIVGWS